MSKRFISVFLVMCMLFSVSPAFAQAEKYAPDSVKSSAALSYSDLKSSHWAVSYIRALSEEGIISGYPNGTFTPEGTVTRAEFAKIITLAAGIATPAVAKSSFSDVASNNWALNYIEAAKAHGIIDGFPGGAFKPNEKVSRAQIAKMVITAKRTKTAAATRSASALLFTDIGGHWAYDFIAEAKQLGVIDGYSSGKFAPNNNATRAEASKIVSGFLAVVRAVNIQDPDLPTIAITSPTDKTEHSTQSSSATIAGTARDNEQVVSVTWTNSLGGQGTAQGTTNWTIPNITLKEGDNLITVTATDNKGKTARDTIKITYALSSAGGGGGGGSGGGGGTPPADTPLEPIIPDTTKVLSNITTGNMSIPPGDPTTITFTGNTTETAQARSLITDDIIVIGVTPETPHGLLRKVTEVSPINALVGGASNVVIKTKQATLDEAIEQGSIRLSERLDPSDVATSTATLEGVELGTVSGAGAYRAAADLGKLYIKIKDAVIHDVDGNKQTTNDQVKVDGEISLEPSVDFSCDVKWSGVERIYFKNTLKEKVEVKISSKQSIELLKAKKQIAEYYFHPIVVQVGPVPVVIVPKLVIYIGADGKIYSSVTAGATQALTAAVGLKYENKSWSSIQESSNIYNYSEPQLSAGCSLKGYVRGQLDLLIYDVTGPYGAADAFIELIADVYANPWWKLHAGIDAAVGVKLEVDAKIFKIEMGYEKIWPLYKKTIAQASGGFLPGGDSSINVREFAISTAPGYQGSPQVSGNYVVWEDTRSSTTGSLNLNIYGYNLSTGKEFAISTAPGEQMLPQVSGNYVVWEDTRNGYLDIYGYNLSTGKEFAISTATGLQMSPQISGNYVVWEDLRSITTGWENLDIYGYNLSTGKEFAISTAPGRQWLPQISGNYVVWEDWRNGNDIYGYNLSTGKEFAISTATGFQGSPQISDNYVVWADWRNGNLDIYGYNLSTGKEFAISTATDEQTIPQISGNYVVWRDNRNGNFDVYGYDLSTGKEFAISTAPGRQWLPQISGNYVVWTDWRNGDYNDYYLRLTNADIYGADISKK